MQVLGFLLENIPVLAKGVRQEVVKRALPVHPDGRRLLEIWNSAGCKLVVGQDIPSRPLARLLQYLALCDYRAGRGDFRIRLAGFGLIRRFGRDISHHYLGEVLSQEEHEYLYAAMMEVRDTGKPSVLDVTATADDQPVLHLEIVLLRVLAADRSTPLILAGMFFF